MKALAVITAIYLPGEFLGTLFGMSYFDFIPNDESSGDSDSSTPSSRAPLHGAQFERYCTMDGKPRRLKHGSLHNFLWLSSRRQEMTTTRTLSFDAIGTMSGSSTERNNGGVLGMPLKEVPSIRQSQILLARREGGGGLSLPRGSYRQMAFPKVLCFSAMSLWSWLDVHQSQCKIRQNGD
jgi:hypothetical protein